MLGEDEGGVGVAAAVGLGEDGAGVVAAGVADGDLEQGPAQRGGDGAAALQVGEYQRRGVRAVPADEVGDDGVELRVGGAVEVRGQ